MDPVSQTRMQPLMDISTGRPDIKIGVIDGPVDFGHPAFHESKIKTVKDSQFGACKNAKSEACKHGTFVMGILSARRWPFCARNMSWLSNYFVSNIWGRKYTGSEKQYEFPSYDARRII